jgi:F-type H+-transporting ATPase subunit alpha
MGLSLFAANEGFLADVAVNKVIAFEAALHAYFNTAHKALMDKINATADYNDAIAEEFRAGITKFKATQTW